MRRQPQRDADLVDFGQGLGEFRAGRRQLRLPLVVHLTAGTSALATSCRARSNCNLRQRQCGLALVERGDPRVQQGDLVVDILHGVLQVPAPAPGLRFDRAHRRGGCLQVCFRGVDRCLLLGDRNLVRLLVQLGEEIALVHTVVVVHQNAGNLSATRGATNVTCPFTNASSVETVLRVCLIQGTPYTAATITTAPSTPIRNFFRRVNR